MKEHSLIKTMSCIFLNPFLEIGGLEVNESQDKFKRYRSRNSPESHNKEQGGNVSLPEPRNTDVASYLLYKSKVCCPQRDTWTAEKTSTEDGLDVFVVISTNLQLGIPYP